MTMDDIRGFLQFPPNLEPEEIIFKEYLLGGVLLNLCHKFTTPTSDWLGVVNIEFSNIKLFNSHNITKVLPRPSKFPTSLKAI